MGSPATTTEPERGAPAPTVTFNTHRNGTANSAADSRSAAIAVFAHDAASSLALCEDLQAEGFAAMPCDPSGREFDRCSEVSCVVVGLSRTQWTRGIETVRSLSVSSRHLPVIVVGDSASPEQILASIRAGASDFVPHPYHRSDLAASVQNQLARAQTSFTHAPAPLPREFATLSDRECEVLDWVVRGYSTKQIAAELGRVEKTVEYHRNRIMKKLRVSSVVQVVRLATLHGWTRSQAEPRNGSASVAAIGAPVA